MLCSPRLRRIFGILLKQPAGACIQVDRLAASLKTSRRTIFRELEGVNDLLTDTGLQLESVPGKGLRLNGTEESKASFEEALDAEDISCLSREERQMLLAFELLRSPDIHKLIYYASMFQVSEATISHDLDAVGPLLGRQGIELIRKGKNGFTISGSEAARRNAMSRIVHEQMPALNMAELGFDPVSLRQIFKEGGPEGIMSLLNQEVLDRVLDVIERNRYTLHLDRFSQPAYVGLILHLVVMVERILNRESIEPGSADPAAMADAESLKEARQLAEWLEEEFEIEIPDVESAFIAMHLEASKASAPDAAPEDDNDRLLRITDGFISGFDAGTQLILRQDSQFMQGLLAHLGPTLIRIDNRLPIYNPLLEQLRQQYKDLFAACLKAAERINEITGIEISNEEVGFLTMHVGAAIERSSMRKEARPVRVGIVCASGIGVSALLAARVQKQFSSQVKVRTLSMGEARTHDFHGSELLLSTFRLNAEGLEVIQVSPLLSDQDIEKIQSRLQVLEHQPPKAPAASEPDSLDWLISLDRLVEAQKETADNLQMTEIQSSAGVEGLILQSAEVLKGNTAILAEDLAAREQLGSVVAPEYGFAMFHAMSEGTGTAQVAFLYPEGGTADFGPEEFKDTKVIAASVIPADPTSEQRKVISDISASLIEDPAFLEAILNRDESGMKKRLSRLFRAQIEASLHKES